VKLNRGTPSYPKENMTEAEKAWLAAFIDADGIIGFYPLRKRGNKITVGVFNDCRPFVQKAAELLGVNVTRFSSRIKGGFKAVNASRTSCKIILRQVIPYLIRKKQKALKALKWLEKNPPMSRVENILNYWQRTGKDFGRITLACEYCGKTFSIYKSKAKDRRFCSRKCYLEWKKGGGKNLNQPPKDKILHFPETSGFKPYSRFFCEESVQHPAN